MDASLVVLTSVATIFGLISTGTAVVAFTRASYAKATIEALRGDVQDRDRRIDFLEDENERKTSALKRQSGEIEVLRDLVTSRAELAEFIELAKGHEVKADARHYEQLSMDQQILTAIESLRETLES